MTSSAVERVGRALERAQASQASLNAFTYLDDERAMDRARSVDALLERGQAPGPMAGVPVALKDLLDHVDRVTTAGSAFYRERATRSAPAVDRLERAGAVIIGRTGLHEFAFGFSSENPHFGPVRNPWDTSTSCGGSSGGSAAAVAAGITPVSIGTDTGGSVRVPAALCGCYGLKVTHGRVPIEGVFPLAASLDTVGPLADSMENIELTYRALSGDMSQQPEPRPLRFGIPQPWYGDAPMAAEVASAFESAVESLRALGHRVEEVEMPGVLPAVELIYAISEEVTEVHREFRARGLPYGEDVARRLDDCAAVTPVEMERGRAWQSMLRSRFATALETADFLLTPTTPVTRKVIGVDSIGDRHYRAVLSWFSAIVNHTLHPALALPLRDTGAPPVSIQVIGPPDSETALIGLGRHLESVGLAGFVPAPVGTR